MNINDRIQTNARSAETGVIKDIRQREGLSPVYIILWDNPVNAVENGGELREGEFKVVTPEDVARHLIAMSNGNFNHADLRAGLLPAMRHLLYWGDEHLLMTAFRMMYDLGLAEGVRQARLAADKEGERALERVKTIWLAGFIPAE